MRLSYFTVALLPIAVLASPFTLETRADQGAKILADLKTTTADSNALKADLDKFGDSDKPSIIQLTALNSAGNKLKKQIMATTTDAKASSTFSKTHAQQIFNYISKVVKPGTVALLQDFIAHEPGFNKGSFDPAIKSALQQQKAAVAALSAALEAKSVAPFKAEGAKVAAMIAAEFNKAIAAFS